MSGENVELVRRTLKTFQLGLAGDDPTIGFGTERVADDLEWVMPSDQLGFRPVYRGRDEFLEFWSTWTEDFAEFSIAVERIVDAGDGRVVALMRQRATGKESHVPVDLDTGVVYEVEGGRVVRAQVFLDQAEALKATGINE